MCTTFFSHENANVTARNLTWMYQQKGILVEAEGFRLSHQSNADRGLQDSSKSAAKVEP